MKATGGKGLSNRGGGKTRSGGGSVTIKKTVARKTKDVNDSVIVLRSALFTPAGADKNVAEGIAPAFMKYDRNGLDLVIQFATKLSKQEFAFAFDLTKEHMEDIYEESGYGWDDSDKKGELNEQGTRFLLIRERTDEGAAPGELRGFVHFRFTIQGEVLDTMAGDPSLYIWDIQLQESVQRKGLGKHLMMLLELIARREKMQHISLPVQLFNEDTIAWLGSMKGYVPDEFLAESLGFDAEAEGFQVYSKQLTAPVRKPEPAPETVFNTPVVEPSPVTITATETEENEEVLELDPVQIIDGLRCMFREKNGRDATEEEVAEWSKAINDLENGELDLGVGEANDEI